MAINKIIDGDNTTVSFSYTAETQRITDTLVDAAHYLYDHGYGDHGDEENSKTFDDLTQGEIGDIVDQHVKRVLKEAAIAYNSVSQQDLARETAITEAETKYI